jgi:hypothetical protein
LTAQVALDVEAVLGNDRPGHIRLLGGRGADVEQLLQSLQALLEFLVLLPQLLDGTLRAALGQER